MFFKKFKASDMKDTYEKAKVKMQKDLELKIKKLCKINIIDAHKKIKKGICNGKEDVVIYINTNDLDLENFLTVKDCVLEWLNKNDFLYSDCDLFTHFIVVKIKESIK